jgi:Protein of unknown function (DUF4239)
VNVNALLQVPAGWLACAATFATVLVACSVHAIVQRIVNHETPAPHNEVAGVILTVMGTLYAVILGFVVVVVWQNYTTASDVVGSEANALAKVYRLARGVEPAGSTIRRHISDYAQAVLTKEWPRMVSTGESDRQTGTIARSIANEVVDLKPTSSPQTNLQAAMLAAVGQFLDDRRSRLTYLRPRIPGILWGVLIFGGMVLLATTFLIGLENRLVQLIMTGALAAMIAVSLVTIFDLELPLEGANHVNPTAWEIFAGPVNSTPQ